ncbi:MAG: error-prone DNA polymerase [Pirellulales bacterium]|nr:error-prone DNA polymerase [Pirellulales bacterium]
MPELRPPEQTSHRSSRRRLSAGSGAYAELRCKSNFSFLEGASHPDELVARAAELGYAALAITDRNTLAGVVRAHAAARQVGLPLLIGAEVALVDAPSVVLLTIDRAGYANLCRLLTLGKRRAEKGDCHLLFADLVAHAENLLACVPLVQRQRGAPSAAQLKSISPAAAAWNGGEQWTSLPSLCAVRELFGDRAYALAELHAGPDDGARLQRMRLLAQQARLPLAASGDAHYHVPQRQALCDVLTAVRWGCDVSQTGQRIFANAERHLQSPRERLAAFAACPETVARTVEIAQRCHFSLDQLRYEYPEELSPPGETPLAYLRRLTEAGAQERYPHGVSDHVRGLLAHELQLIEELRYEAYFLTVWDLVRFARSRGILCQGRGSAANSVVCYCLGVTSVAPEQLDVLFERFISKERNEAPDIDVDFEHERREEVLQYIYEKYGRQRAAMTAEVICYRPKSAIRDVGKALGISLDRVDALAKLVDPYGDSAQIAQRVREAGLDPQSPVVQRLIPLVRELLGFPRHLSQHVGGMVITRAPLCELVPIENAAMPGRTVIEWNKDDLDELGILKVDCLSLGMLTAIRKCFDLIRERHDRRLTLADVPEGDQQVYDMICRADTIGVFQIESRAQMSMLPRLKPRCYYDLVVEVAIVRPGPIQGNMVHPYLRRRTQQEKVTYPNEAVRQVLEKTLGVPLFQEQAMRLAVVAAGFTPGEADQLRRAMAAWRRPGLIGEFRKKLIDGMLANGLSEEFAIRLFQQIQGFGEYGFPESHAASFARLVYVSAWLKRYYPAEFCAALVNSQPMGFYAPSQLVRDAREHDVEVLPVDVNYSHWDCVLEGGAVRLGLRLVSGLSAAHAARVEKGRRPFRSLDDLVRRTGLKPATIALLARSDAFGSLALTRRQSLWQSLSHETKSQPLLADLEDDEPLAELPAMSDQEEVAADFRLLGLSLKAHPMSFLRGEMEQLRVTPAAQLRAGKDGGLVRVAGIVLVRQRPSTAKGITFVTLEDETGVANLIIRMQVWERYHRVARTAVALVAQGRLQIQHDVVHVLVSKLEDVGARLRVAASQSRDFH